MLDVTCGEVVEKDDVDTLEERIRFLCIQKPYDQENCINKAKSFEKSEKFNEYVMLYEIKE